MSLELGRMDRIKFVTQMAGRSPLQKLLANFDGAGDEVAIRCFIQSGERTTYVLSQHLGNRKYYTVNLYASAGFADEAEFMAVNQSYINTLYGGFNDSSTPAVTLSGAWATANGAYPGGRLMYIATDGAYAQFVTPDGASAVGVIHQAGSTGCGVAKVTIDGDATLATELPTAQDLVTAGTLADTVLVANGGSLNPTDRVWNSYNKTANYNGPQAGVFQLFAKNMTPAAHTVRITVTGYKQAAASAANVLFYLMLAHGAGLYNIASATYEACLIADVELCSTVIPPRVEISYNTTPTGATGAQWIGHTASLKFTEAPVVTVDGEVQTLAHLSAFTGSSITVGMQFRGRHTEIGGGSTNIGLLTIAYKMDAVTGFWVSHSMAWAVGGVATGYPCMLTVGHNVFDRFNCIGSGVVGADLTANDDSTAHFASRNKVAFAWDYDGYVAALMYIPDLAKTVENWSKAPTRQLDWADISAASGTWKKAYPTRFQSSEIVTNATVWEAEANYRANWFASGADAVFSAFK